MVLSGAQKLRDGMFIRLEVSPGERLVRYGPSYPMLLDDRRFRPPH